jgi:hypothetical protein
MNMDSDIMLVVVSLLIFAVCAGAIWFFEEV